MLQIHLTLLVGCLVLGPGPQSGSQPLNSAIEKANTSGEKESLAIHHLDGLFAGWSVTQTASFRIYHQHSPQLAEQAARAAETARATCYRKWFGEVHEDWNPPCDLYLHPDGSAYNQATGVPAQVAGHTTTSIDRGQLISRRIDLRCDAEKLLLAVIPHEVTHAVLAGRFGEQRLPLWASEAMAVLSEPREVIQRHLRDLPRYRQEDRLFSVAQLVQFREYPQPPFLRPYYAQSVSLVELLTSEKGPQTFTLFLREGLRDGLETSLKQHYGWDLDDLQQRWQSYAFADPFPRLVSANATTPLRSPLDSHADTGAGNPSVRGR